MVFDLKVIHLASYSDGFVRFFNHHIDWWPVISVKRYTSKYGLILPMLQCE